MFRSRMIAMATLALLALGLSPALSACAGQPGAAQSITIADAWARPGEAGGTSAIYFVIDNPGTEEDSLLAAQTDAAQSAELHRSAMDDHGAMSMEHQEQVPVPAGGKVEFAPGGLHVMLVGLDEALQPGDNLSLTLTFEKAGEMNLTVPVREP